MHVSGLASRCIGFLVMVLITFPRGTTIHFVAYSVLHGFSSNPYVAPRTTVYIPRFSAVYALQTLHSTRFIRVNLRHFTL